LVAISRSIRKSLKAERFPFKRAIALALLLGVPALGLYCLQWAQVTTAPDFGNRQALPDYSQLSPKRGYDARVDFQVGESAAAPGRLSSPNDPFSTRSRAGMLSALDDPFYEALSSGAGQGVLVLQSTSHGVPTYGAPSPARRTISATDRSLLREIRITLAGSFTNFLDNAYGNPSAMSGKQIASPPQQNPFVKSSDATAAHLGSADAAPATSQETGSTGNAKPASDAGATNESKPSTDSAPQQKPADPAPQEISQGPMGIVIGAPGKFTAVRPNVILHVDGDGVLQAMAAAQIRDQLFETAELGARQFNMLLFAQPAEIPTALAVADLNGDGIPDVCSMDAREGLLHILYGTPEGSYVEGMKIDVGSGPRSVAAGDFNRDGRVDIAISNIGIGTLTIVYLGEPGMPPSFRSGWLDKYRDFVGVADMSGSGAVDLLGMSFANQAEVLDIGRTDGALAGRTFPYAAALSRKVGTLNGFQLQMNVILMKSNLSLNLQNFQNQMVNVLNLQAGSDIYVIVGDINYGNAISVALATLGKQKIF
jgi:hypothetical protein